MSTRRRILIVEDDPEMRAFIAEALEDSGEVVEAEDFDEALRLLESPERPRFTLAIVDCLLPSRSRQRLPGVELVRRVKMRWPSLPMVVMTGADLDERVIIESFRNGARDFLRKPFDLDELMEAVERATGRHPRERTSSPHESMTEVIDFIGKHYMEPLTLSELATIAAMSRWHFCRVFRASTGVPLRDYLRDLRLDRATSLLLASKLSLTEIAHEVGFYDLPHFDKTFRRRFSVSPTEFVRAARTRHCPRASA